jgi:hypothetical protein
MDLHVGRLQEAASNDGDVVCRSGFAYQRTRSQMPAEASIKLCVCNASASWMPDARTS